LCGEGVENAAPEAFLAAAVVQAALSGEDVKYLGQHYTSRLMYGFQCHLEVCLRFYNSSGSGEFWREECDILEEEPPPRYRLVGQQLVSLVGADL
jgi:hypothetical protein